MTHPATQMIMLFTIAALVLSALDGCRCVTPSVQTLLGSAFFLVAPGFGWVRALRLGEWWVEWTLVLAVSLALDAVIGLLLVYFPQVVDRDLGPGLMMAVALGGLLCWRLVDWQRALAHDGARGAQDG